MRHRLFSLLAVGLTVGCGDALAPDAIDPPVFAKVTGTFDNSDCQFEQKGNKFKLLNDCTSTGITLGPGTKFDGKKHTITVPAGFALKGEGGSFEVKHVSIECTGGGGGIGANGSPVDRSKIKVQHVRVSGCSNTAITVVNATHGSKVSHNHIDTPFFGVYVQDSDNVKVDHNEVAGASFIKLVLFGVQDSKVSHNTLTGTGTPCFDLAAPGVNQWKKNKNLTGTPDALCPL